MEVKDVMKCSFSSWYERFKELTSRSVIIALPDEFITYLQADGVILPESICNNRPPANSDDESDNEDWEDSTSDFAKAPQFDELNAKIKESIKELGGKVFPKLNWSSPRDATWIAVNNCCSCATVEDVYLLLKSSDFIMHDITQPFLHCSDFDSSNNQNSIQYHLILREWQEINPDMEFRCFVKGNVLIGITQRDLSSYFEYNVRNQQQIVDDIKAFFHRHIESKFDCHNYVFDIVRRKKGDIYLLDFNPFGPVTDSLLFEWNELIDESVKDKCLPEYRCIDTNRGIQPRPLANYAVPLDVVDMATGEDPFKFADFLKLKMEDLQFNTSSDEDDN